MDGQSTFTAGTVGRMKRKDFNDPEALMYGIDMPSVDKQTLTSRVQITLNRYPALKEIFPEEFVTTLVARSRDVGNYLLLWLANPGNHIADQHWKEVAADLTLLAPERSLAHYTPKLRITDHHSVEAAKTDLELAAWLKRRGLAIKLEPRIEASERLGDFFVKSEPLTWWEIKSVQDTKTVLAADCAHREIAKRLKRTREPYIFNVHQRGIRPEQVPAALKEVARRVRLIDSENASSLPIAVDVPGLTRSRREIR